MKPKEVRIGNYAYYPNNNNTPFHKIEIEDLVTCINVYKPIPLTEEWWGKFEYESIQHFVTHLIDESIHPISDDMPEWVESISSLPIHKIQNLWYELTGTELTIKT